MLINNPQQAITAIAVKFEESFEKVAFKNIGMGSVFKYNGMPVQKIDEPTVVTASTKSSVQTSEEPKALVEHQFGHKSNAFSTHTGGFYIFHPDTIVEARSRAIKSPKWRK